MHKRPTHSRFSASAASLVAFALIVSACSGGASAAPTGAATAGPTATSASSVEPTAAGVKITKIAVIAPEKGNDFGWNQQGVDGAKAAASAVGATIEVADGAGYDDPSPILRQLAAGGAQFIVAQASGYNTAAPQFATESGIPVLVYDAPSATKPGLVADVVTNAQQGAYLAGVLAAKMTKTGILGMVISADTPSWHKANGGFVAGAKSVNPSIRFLQAQDTPEKGGFA